MGTVVQFKRSSTTNDKPTSSQLVAGELAVNTADGKLFLEKDSGAVVEVAFGDNELILNDSVIYGTIQGPVKGPIKFGAHSGSL